MSVPSTGVRAVERVGGYGILDTICRCAFQHSLGYEKEESRRTSQILDYASGKMELLSAEMRKTLEGTYLRRGHHKHSMKIR